MSTISSLLSQAQVQPALVHGDAEITSITSDSRTASSGSLFVCTPRLTRDSEQFLPSARANGAVAAMVSTTEGFRTAVDLGMSAIWVPADDLQFEDAIWRLCDAFYEHPTRHLKVFGITGTNGKTTTAWLVRDMLATLGYVPAYLGTLGIQMPGVDLELGNTTPFPVDLYYWLDRIRGAGCNALAIEVSSHALAQRRIDGVEFDVAAFTNLTQDHLDFHKTMEEYEAAKWRLYTALPRESAKPFVGAFNVDNQTGRQWYEQFAGSKVSFSLKDGDLVGEPLDIGLSRILLRLSTPSETETVVVPLGGSYNVENSLTAVASLLAGGIPFKEICRALAAVRPVPGRFEPVQNDLGIDVIVDYAHTPDALEKLLDAVKPITKGRVITVFGCGGDRDRTKRPIMASVASQRSDITLITSDNPRTEDPVAIIDEVRKGLIPGAIYRTFVDRGEAVAFAIEIAEPGDAVVLAGKGHENYQVIGRDKIHMDDREMAREALAKK